MQPPVVDERTALDRQTLRLFFRSRAPFFACELRDIGGGTAKTAPLLPIGGEYSCQFDLGDLAAGVYSIAVRPPDGVVQQFGRESALRHLAIARAGPGKTGSAGLKVTGSTFARGAGNAHAWLYVDARGPELRLRISGADDIDAFLDRPDDETKAKPIRFSVVSPVYNVDKYLDEFFRSITSQTLDFKSRIELIMVDDGSTDRSAKIIKRWQRKFPTNIKYVHQENGGLSSARNRGLKEASHEWITFTDPDDYVAPDYFERVGESIQRHGEETVAAVSCNAVYFLEDNNAILDAHPLRYRFASGERSVATDDLGRDYQITVCHAFWRHDLIADNQLAFDGRIRPGSEDAHFSGRYLLRAPGKVLVFQPLAKYFHRRRADQSSLSQTGWMRPGTYDDELRFGHLDLLREARERTGRVPVHVQNMILYCLSWALRRAVDHPDAIAFLSAEQRRNYLDLLRQTFASIDVDTIAAFGTNLPLSHRVGILNIFKDADIPAPIVEIDEIDAARGLVRVAYWSRDEKTEDVFRWGDRVVAPAFAKVRRIDFLGSPFVFEHIRWLPFDGDGPLRAAIGDREARITLPGQPLAVGVSLADIRAALAPRVPDEALLPQFVRDVRQAARSPKAIATFANAWLLMDRDTEADDSAEFLYRYVRRRSPETNAFFVLQRRSPHWDRLAADGFRLIGFNEPEHAIALLNATFLISSQADHYVTDYLGRAEFGDMLGYRFVFLQHGITQGDFSEWFNQRNIDLVTTSTFPEHAAFVADGSPYRLSEKEVVLTGLPRHDALIGGEVRDGRLIVIMPTWRLSLSGPALEAGNRRSVNPAFYDSDFARRWKSVLRSPRLATAAAGAGCRVVFLPHPNLLQYLDFFELPAGVEVRTFGDGESIQDLFRSLSLFVTDYSSKAFDVAYLNKPLVYYQFDPEIYFGGGHTGRRGYFDFERDGFGPVCRTEDDLLEAIETALSPGAADDATYRKRAAATFAFRDGGGSERVFEAILTLDRPARPNADA